ncbi:LysR family transcriptional regulator [Aquibium oceanicum]|uniref:LysR family transcriptional regulator n=1 Tax=Aquibium oceanicum TaxID=1670800 RepID=A0A1L3STC6_9HYPH|nr:LysR family transcriptional regulator [Aquibium oceanicum]APH72649.1 LysR family transcriptional regulator [Aquibium oceanicum]
MEFRQNFRALQAFEAVSRHGSVSRAAEELGVSQSAVSHQLRLLGDLVGERLLRKEGRGIALTEAGASLAGKLQEAFAAIERSVGDTIGRRNETVRLAVCSSFGPGWLVPRLSQFYAANPLLDLHLHMYASDPELTDAVADAFVTTLPTEKGFYSLLLWPERLVPVVASATLSDGAPRLITTDLTRGRIGHDWHRHSELAGRPTVKPPGGRWLFASHYVTALEMVRAGLGAALVPDFLVARDVEVGSLSLLDDTAIPTSEDYYLCIKESRREEPALETLVRWFRGQISARSSLSENAAWMSK